MTSPLTIVETFPGSVEAPIAHEEVTAQTVIVGEQSLANRTEYLRHRGRLIAQAEWHMTKETFNIATDLVRWNTASYAVNIDDANALSVSFSSVRAGDVFLITFYGLAVVTGGPGAGNNLYVRAHATDNFGGGGVEGVLTSGGLDLFAMNAAPRTTSFAGRHTAGASGTTRIRVLGKVDTAGAWSAGVAQVIMFRVSHFRIPAL